MRKNQWLFFGFVAILFYTIVHFLKNKLGLESFKLSIFRWVILFIFIIHTLNKKNLTNWILISMVIGVEVGLDFPKLAVDLRFLSKIFLKLISSIVAPILFSTLVVGIAGHANIRQLGRIGWKSILYFEIVTTIALIIGLAAINISKAGVGITPPIQMPDPLPQVEPQNWQEIILHVFPENFVKSIYHGDTLAIVVFSILFSIALAMLNKENRQPLLDFMESLSATMFKFTRLIMYFAPIGVFSAIAYTVGHMGLEVLYNLFKLLITLYVALFFFLLLVLLPILLYIKVPIKAFIKALSEPVSLAFATTTSEAALPIIMENFEKLGVPRKIIAFVVPTGYSFNLDGTTLYLSLASIFVAQAAGIELSIAHQIFICLTLILTSKGVAGVPRASMVILLGTANSFGLPIWPIIAIVGIDELMDMARTTVNVIGNALASCVIARWEGEFDDQKALNYLKEG